MRIRERTKKGNQRNLKEVKEGMRNEDWERERKDRGKWKAPMVIWAWS